MKKMKTKTTIGTDSVFIGGIEYVPATQNQVPAINTEGLPYVIIRTRDAGVHAGFLVRKESTLAGVEVTLTKSRRIWYWEGAFTLSALATEGTKKPDKCKFSCHVNHIDLVAIEITPTTQVAMDSIEGVKVWEG